jgi:MFS family permease
MTSQSTTDSYPSARYSWFVVAILSFAGVVSYVDRTIMNLLVGPIRADLNITDTQFSLLQGFAFSLFYAALAIPLARLSDTGNRKYVIIGGVVCWSLATFGSGLATSFFILFVARMFIGVGEATLTPGGYSLISDYFPKEKLSAAISVFTASSFLGSGIALIVGGALITHLNTIGTQELPLLGALKPWQMTFIIVSIPSILVVALMLLVKEPKRQASVADAGAQVDTATFGEFLTFMRSKGRIIFAIYFGLTFLAAMFYAVNSWVPEFLIRKFAWSPSDVGAIFGPMVIVLCYSGMTIGGWVCNKMVARGITDANLRLPVIAAICGLPFIAGFGLMPTSAATLICLAPAMFFGAMPFGIGTAALPLITPNRMRAQAVAGYLFVANLLSYGLGPTAVTAFSDFALGGNLGLSFAIVLPILIVIGIAILLSGLKPYRAMVAQDEKNAQAA